ncbi:MAG: AAA+ family ATPase [Desulfobacula sp. GWF2_41_7]|nr:MAG: AAA+ family ATPase [Desulfobacula sp. GWF2_41_7]
MLYRFAETYLETWLNKANRKPLVLRGARQVGKSTLVREFARKREKKLIEINLERHLYLDDIFKTLDMESALREIEALSKIPVSAPNTILFLDEIQATPHALQLLRYFFEEKKELPVIAAGSLVEFTLADHSFSMPVGRIEYMHLGPLTFNEFVTAVEPSLTKYIENFSIAFPLPITAHEKLKKRQRDYMLIGGMPEAVQVWCETGSIQDVADIHRSITETYQDDFSKYARSHQLALMQRVFRTIPRIVGGKIKYSNISREHPSRNIKDALELFSKAKICHRVYHSHCSGLPLNADIKETVYKLLFMDIGMMNYICGNDWTFLQSFPDHELVNEGAIAEQFIGQHLLSAQAHSPSLNYWVRQAKTSNAEIDYVISHGPLIIPVEVKSGKSGSLKSLHQFVTRKNTLLAVRFDLNPPSIQVVSHQTGTSNEIVPAHYTLLSLPLYLVETLPNVLNEIRTQF